MKKLEVRLRFAPDAQHVVGLLAEHERRVYFEYSDRFLGTGWQPSPVHLKARPGLIEHTDPGFGPLPGLFEDSLPDGWGLLLMDRHFRKRGVDPDTLSPLDRLQLLGTRTMGALTYHPSAEPTEDAPALDLARLAEGAKRVLRGSATAMLAELLAAGGSPQGARPKVLVGVRGDEVLHGEDDLPEGYAHWLVKFFADTDKPDHGRMEVAYSRMAKAAGIDVPDARLFEVRVGRRKHAFFGARRFDRAPGNRRLHAHTLGNLIHVPLQRSRDYEDLFRATRAIMHGDHVALLECFRRMVFNVASHNRDDHVRNFAYLMNDAGAWSLSPAYDLAFSPGPRGHHQMAIGGESLEPTRESCLALGEKHGVRKSEGVAIIEQVNEAVGRWRKLAKDAGCRMTTIRTVWKSLRPL